MPGVRKFFLCLSLVWGCEVLLDVSWLGWGRGKECDISVPMRRWGDIQVKGVGVLASVFAFFDTELFHLS